PWRLSGEVSALGPEVPGSKPDSTGDYWACCTLNHTYGDKRPSVGVVWKFGRGISPQVLSSSPNRGSKSWSPSQNLPCVASKRDVNIANQRLFT
ncbi:hypothetical protein AVEN_144954-1, partial [Araneus ventricosus]